MPCFFHLAFATSSLFQIEHFYSPLPPRINLSSPLYAAAFQRDCLTSERQELFSWDVLWSSLFGTKIPFPKVPWARGDSRSSWLHEDNSSLATFLLRLACVICQPNGQPNRASLEKGMAQRGKVISSNSTELFYGIIEPSFVCLFFEASTRILGWVHWLSQKKHLNMVRPHLCMGIREVWRLFKLRLK